MLTADNRVAPQPRRRRRRTSLVTARIVCVFDCLACQGPLAVVMADKDHRTFLMLGPMAKLRHGTVECDCGAEREFVSVHVPPRIEPLQAA